MYVRWGVCVCKAFECVCMYGVGGMSVTESNGRVYMHRW